MGLWGLATGESEVGIAGRCADGLDMKALFKTLEPYYAGWKSKPVPEIKEKLAALGLSLGMTFEPDLLESPKEEAPQPAL